MAKKLHFLFAALFLLSACSVPRIQENQMSLALNLAGEDSSRLPSAGTGVQPKDTLKVMGENGEEILIMRAVKDSETGEMVATDVIDAAVVTARFRNVAERGGMVNLIFRIDIKEEFAGSDWQLRLLPTLKLQGDSVRLEKVIVSGQAYREAQLRGYEQYGRFLSKIVSDTASFVNVNQMEIFLRRYAPELYALRSETGYVSDEAFEALCREAADHYTNRMALRANERRKSLAPQKFHQYVKDPIASEGVKLDTVLSPGSGRFIYDYCQPLAVKPGVKKVVLVIDGDIYSDSKRLYSIARSEPLTFYISTLTSFAYIPNGAADAYRDGVEALRQMDYKRALSLLSSYRDFNTALAYTALGYNASAIDVLEGLERSPRTDYLLAVLHSRRGEHEQALQHYMDACRSDASFVYRGNLDPEIASLIDMYGLNGDF